MSRLIDGADADPELRTVFESIKTARGVEDVDNFWKALAAHRRTLRRAGESLCEVMVPGALDPLTKEPVYLAVNATNDCDYDVASHRKPAEAKGVSNAVFGELTAVVGMANETNRLANALHVHISPSCED